MSRHGKQVRPPQRKEWRPARSSYTLPPKRRGWGEKRLRPWERCAVAAVGVFPRTFGSPSRPSVVRRDGSVTAASLALNQRGGGSNPPGPMAETDHEDRGEGGITTKVRDLL